MLSFRIIGKICILNGIAVQSYKYKDYLPIGKPEVIVEYLNKWGIDEIMIMDIKNSIFKSNFVKNNIREIIKNCNTPITIGGGISSIKDVEYILRNGADKVVINSAFIDNFNLLKKIVYDFGSQAIVCSVDYKINKNNFNLYSYSGTKKNNINICDYFMKLEDSGVGEILINSIDNNGQKNGLDFRFVNKYRKYISCPIILSCGVNSPEHIIGAINQKIDAVAIGNYLNHFEHSVILLKKYLKSKKKKDLIRLDTNIKYKYSNFDDNLRLKPNNDLYLQKMNKAF